MSTAKAYGPYTMLLGVKPDCQTFSLDTSDEVEKYEIAACRCVKCGHLEWYAETRYY